jgi:hypothetical protein
VPNRETATIYVGGSSTLEFTRLVSLIADLENSNAFVENGLFARVHQRLKWLIMLVCER